MTPSLPRWLLWRGLSAGLIAFALAAAGMAVAQPAPGDRLKPARIVSLNMCTDQLVLRLAAPERIASVTWLSRDQRNSNVAPLAARVGINHGLAEEIVPLDPDLIIAGMFSTRTAVALLKQIHIPLTEFGIASSFADIRAQIRDIARLVGEYEKGERLIAQMDQRLAAIAPLAGVRPRAIVFNPNGATVGRGTLVGEIMARAGLDNIAATLGIENYGLLPLETVVSNAIDILIVSAARDGPPALATEILRHPVLAKLSGRVKIVTVPAQLWNCGGPEAVEAVEYLRRAVDDLRREKSS